MLMPALFSRTFISSCDELCPGGFPLGTSFFSWSIDFPVRIDLFINFGLQASGM